MDIILARLDNRLLHGIIATQWVQQTRCERLMIIDDEVANDNTKKDIMRIAKPAGIPLSIITLSTAIENFKNGKYAGKRVFVVVKKPSTLVSLMMHNISIEEITIGGSGCLENETIKLSSRYSCSEEDKIQLDKLKDTNTPLFIQYVPADIKIKY